MIQFLHSILNLPKRNKNTPTHTDNYARIFRAALFTIDKLETTQKPVNRIDNLWYIYTMEYYSAIRRNEQMLDTAKFK